MKSRFKIFSDPVHGFVSVPRGILLDLIQTDIVQRLRRIRQIGIGYLVFPGAEHSRLALALGAMALMHDALSALTEKGTAISPEEHRAAMAAALLHDVGHGPFSHTLEHEIIHGFEHERMSRVFIEQINGRFDGELDLALAIFDGEYERPFFHQLVSSQLDMDRLDYLRRDSYYTGVVEGRVGVARIIKTLRVHPDDGSADDRIVVEDKGMHAVENFLVARRLMYWQVYLHKTVLAGDELLRSVIRRVRHHFREDRQQLVSGTSPAFRFFLERPVDAAEIDSPEVIAQYAALDDSDILFSLKQWRSSPDPILADLSRRILDRDFFRVSFLAGPVGSTTRAAWRERIAHHLVGRGLSSDRTADDDARYYLAFAESRHEAYETADQSIGVVRRDGQVVELSEATRVSLVAGIAGREQRAYVCYPKELDAPLDLA